MLCDYTLEMTDEWAGENVMDTIVSVKRLLKNGAKIQPEKEEEFIHQSRKTRRQV